MPPKANGEGGELSLTGLREWFGERGHCLYVEMSPGSWIARYPKRGQPVGAGPTARGGTALEAAAAARAEYLAREA